MSETNDESALTTPLGHTSGGTSRSAVSRQKYHKNTQSRMGLSHCISEEDIETVVACVRQFLRAHTNFKTRNLDPFIQCATEGVPTRTVQEKV